MLAEKTQIIPDGQMTRAAPIVMIPGVIVWTWCRKHMTRTDHLWTGWRLACLACEPELDTREKSETLEPCDCVSL